MEKKLPPLICIVGTNASGKSGLAVRLAEHYSGEIVSADSRQVFRGLDLGSGKITPDEMHGIPHHLLDVAEPNEFFSMADFQRLAYQAIGGILERGNLPFLAGGTGLYVDSVAEGFLLSGHAPDLAYRAHLETYSTEELYVMLLKKMPGTDVDPKNRNRAMRLLERIQSGDDLTPRKEKRYDTLWLGVTWPRPVLCERIDERLKRRMAHGMEQEVRQLLENGATAEFLDGLGLEYRFLSRYILGQYPDQAEMLEDLARAIKRFAKRQMIWFRKNKEIQWLNMEGDPYSEACERIDAFLQERS